MAQSSAGRGAGASAIVDRRPTWAAVGAATGAIVGAIATSIGSMVGDGVRTGGDRIR